MSIAKRVPERVKFAPSASKSIVQYAFATLSQITGESAAKICVCINRSHRLYKANIAINEDGHAGIDNVFIKREHLSLLGIKVQSKVLEFRHWRVQHESQLTCGPRVDDEVVCKSHIGDP